MKICLNIMGVISVASGFFAGVVSGSFLLFVLLIALGILGSVPFFAISYLLTEVGKQMEENKKLHESVYALKNRINVLEEKSTNESQ